MDLAHLLAAIACRQSRIHCERRLIKFANRDPQQSTDEMRKLQNDLRRHRHAGGSHARIKKRADVAANSVSRNRTNHL